MGEVTPPLLPGPTTLRTACADDRSVDELLEVVDDPVGPVPAELVGADEEDVAADPEHGGGADARQPGEHDRHGSHQEPAGALAFGRAEKEDRLGLLVRSTTSAVRCGLVWAKQKATTKQANPNSP